MRYIQWQYRKWDLSILSLFISHYLYCHCIYLIFYIVIVYISLSVLSLFISHYLYCHCIYLIRDIYNDNIENEIYNDNIENEIYTMTIQIMRYMQWQYRKFVYISLSILSLFISHYLYCHCIYLIFYIVIVEI
jgi:hypothetical protein